MRALADRGDGQVDHVLVLTVRSQQLKFDLLQVHLEQLERVFG